MEEKLIGKIISFTFNKKKNIGKVFTQGGKTMISCICIDCEKPYCGYVLFKDIEKNYKIIEV